MAHINPIEKLLSYQKPHVEKLFNALLEYNCVLDGSDTGTGKTYTTLAVCYLLAMKPFIICPKSVISNWINVSKEMDIEILGLANYEKMKNGKYYTCNYEQSLCPYMDKLSKKEFVFQLPEDTLIVIDEAHRCKNHKTQNSNLLISLKHSERKIILLSATITDKEKCFRPFGVIFGFYNTVKDYGRWMKKQIMMKRCSESKIIHDVIYTSQGSRIKIKELGDLFPINQVIAKCYYSDDYQKVNQLYDEINKALKRLSEEVLHAGSGLAEIIKLRMQIEMYKLPIILDLINDALELGFAVVVFVNFRNSMNYLCGHLKIACSLIYGGQTLEERKTNIDEFQENKKNVIISIIQAGGVGISLHDLHGKARMSIISPSWSGTDLVQALGRIHRAGSKSPALQRIVYMAKTCEEGICNNVQKKLDVLAGINDGDTVFKHFPLEKLKEIGEYEDANRNVVIENVKRKKYESV
jgi:SNF2 family DNA or RNA helicase